MTENNTKQKNNAKNQIIDKLIKKFEAYLKFTKEKLKITDLFKGFENSARNDLQTLLYFVLSYLINRKLSNDRYKAMKSGGSLNKIMEIQEPFLTHFVFYQFNF